MLARSHGLKAAKDIASPCAAPKAKCFAGMLSLALAEDFSLSAGKMIYLSTVIGLQHRLWLGEMPAVQQKACTLNFVLLLFAG